MSTNPLFLYDPIPTVVNTVNNQSQEVPNHPAPSLRRQNLSAVPSNITVPIRAVLDGSVLNPEVPRWNIKEFSKGILIGNGSYGLVYKATHLLLGTIVYKVDNGWKYDKNRPEFTHEKYSEMQRREFKNCMQLNYHPNIVNVCGFIYDINVNVPIGFISELLAGDLSAFIYVGDNIPDIRMNTWARQLAIGLSFIHSLQIMHRDLKPNNILLTHDHNRVKICDFGLSKQHRQNDNHTRDHGNRIYSAPEIALTEKYDFPVDVWSYAMVLYFIFYKKSPYEPSYANKFMRNTFCQMLIGDGEKEPLRPALDGKQIDHIIRNCWKSNPSERCQMRQVVEYFYSDLGRQFDLYEI